MSFGYTVGDFIVVANLVRSILKDFRDASRAFDALRRKIKSLHDDLSKIRDELPRDDPLSSHTSNAIFQPRWFARTWVVQELSIRGRLQFICGKPNFANNEVLADRIGETWSNLLSLEEELENLSVKSEFLSCGRRPHPCIVPKCKVGPFTRLYDLQRHIRTIHKLDRRELKCSWPNLLERIKADLSRCREALCTEQGEKACSIAPSQIDKGSRDPDLMVARTYLLWGCCNCEHVQCKSCRFINWHLSLLAVTGFLAVFLMSASFIWLDHTAALEKPSSVVNLIIPLSMKMIPAQVVRSSRLVQQSSIIAVYLLSCVLYSISTIAWFVLRLQKSSMYCWYIFGLAAAIFWILLGVTPAELFLVFLPLSVSIVVCLQTICVGLIVNPSAGTHPGPIFPQTDFGTVK